MNYLEYFSDRILTGETFLLEKRLEVHNFIDTHKEKFRQQDVRDVASGDKKTIRNDSELYRDASALLIEVALCNVLPDTIRNPLEHNKKILETYAYDCVNTSLKRRFTFECKRMWTSQSWFTYPCKPYDKMRRNAPLIDFVAMAKMDESTTHYHVLFTMLTTISSFMNNKKLSKYNKDEDGNDKIPRYCYFHNNSQCRHIPDLTRRPKQNE
jgi:hypothetical protein